MIIKPEGITKIDWEILIKKYPGSLKEIEKKIRNHYPVQYLIGNVEFCDTKLEVSEDVLIPRFETEYLVEKVWNKIKKYPENSLNILDIGTGSGCICINLAKKLSQSFFALDISEKALEVAKKNAKYNKVNINFFQMDILKEKIKKNYDIIISNPPYVSENEEVDPATKYEPQYAIFAKKDGLEFYEKILEHIPNIPKLIAFEIGYNQRIDVINLAKNRFPTAKIICEKDLSGKDRYIFIENE